MATYGYAGRTHDIHINNGTDQYGFTLLREDVYDRLGRLVQSLPAWSVSQSPTQPLMQWDWTHGAFHYFLEQPFLTPDVSIRGYADGENIDGSIPGLLILGPKEQTTSGTLQTMPGKIFEHQGRLMALTNGGSGTAFVRYNEATNTFDNKTTGLTGVIDSTIFEAGAFDGIVLVAHGGAHPYDYSTDYGDTWVASTLSGNSGKAHLFHVVGDTLYKSLGKRIQTSVDPTNSGSWTTERSLGDTIQALGTWNDGLLVLTKSALGYFDESETFHEITKVGQYIAGTGVTESQEHIVSAWNSSFIAIARRVLMELDQYGNVFPNIFPTDAIEVTSGDRVQILRVDAGRKELYVYCLHGTDTRKIWKGLKVEGQWRWHPIIKLAQSSTDLAAALHYSEEIEDEPRLWIGTENAAGAGIINYAYAGNPLSESSYLFQDSGKIVTSWAHQFYPSAVAVTDEVHGRRFTTATVTGEYATDLSETYASHTGTADTVPSEDLTFPSGTSFEWIRRRFTLSQTSTGDTETPQVTGLVLTAVRDLYQFSIVVGKGVPNLTGVPDAIDLSTLVTFLQDLRGSKSVTLGEFGTGTEKTVWIQSVNQRAVSNPDRYGRGPTLVFDIVALRKS